MAGKFKIIKTDSGFHFNLTAGNNEIIATSEVYTTLAACKNGIESVKTNSQSATIEDQTVEGYEKCPAPKFEIYKDKKGEFRFRLKATNGQIIAASEGYKEKAGCKNGIKSVTVNAPEAPVIEE